MSSSDLMVTETVEAVPRPRLEPTFDSRHAAGFSLLALILVLLIPTVLITQTPVDKRLSGTLVLHLVILAHSGVALAAALVGRHARPMQIGFWTFVYIWLGLAGTLQVMTHEFPWPGIRPEATHFTAALVIELGLIAFCIGLFVSSQREWHAGRLGRQFATLELRWGRVMVLSVTALVLAVVMIPLLGGLDAFLTTREEATQATQAASAESTPGVKTALLNWGLAVPAFWALAGLLYAKFPARMARPRWLLLGMLAVLNVVVNNPLSQPRFWFGTVLFGLVFAAPWTKSIRVFRALAVALIVLLLITFPFTDAFRASSQQGSFEGLGTMSALSEQLRNNADYDAVQQVASGVAFVEADGHQPRMGISTALFLVPRSLWSDKTQAAGTTLAQFEGYPYRNLSSPLWVEAYIWGGWLVVAVVLFLFGVLAFYLDRIYDRWRGSPRHTAVTLVASLAFFQILVLRGSLLSALGPLLLLVVIPLALSAVVTRQYTSPAGRPQS